MIAANSGHSLNKWSCLHFGFLTLALLYFTVLHRLLFC